MAKKSVGTKGKKGDILKAACNCFLRNGYDGTSIREIMKEANAEVGLFYYYFEGKDDVFHQAMEYFYKDALTELSKIVECAEEDSFRVLSRIFGFLRKLVRVFMEKYEDKLHPSMKGALRDSVLENVTNYVEKTLEILVSKGAKLRMEVNVAARFMTYGVGGIVLHEELDNQHTETEVRKCINVIMGLTDEEAELINPVFATKDDAEAILKLEQSFGEKDAMGEGKIGKRLHEEEIIVVRQKGRAIGFVLFDRDKCRVEKTVIHSDYDIPLTRDVLNQTAWAEIKEGLRKKDEAGKDK